MTEQTARDVLWAHTDRDGDTGRLIRDGYAGSDAVAHLDVPHCIVDLDRDAVRRLRNACDRFLGDGGGAEALHIAQHRQVEAAARRSARHVDEQAGMLARLADVLDPGAEADPSALLGTMHVILDVQRRTVASLGDLLAALAGQP